MKVETLLTSIFKSKADAARYFSITPPAINMWERYSDYVPCKHIIQLHKDPNIDYSIDDDGDIK
jgi:hypothetical protein